MNMIIILFIINLIVKTIIKMKLINKNNNIKHLILTIMKNNKK